MVKPTIGKQGMVASSQPLATEIGLAILQRGGSAVDAAIATNAALGLVEPHMCGIGGDLFAIVWDQKSQQLYGLNGSGRSARNLSYADLQNRLTEKNVLSIPMDDVLSVSVPGAVDAWYSLHDRFGRLSMADVLTPSIDHANKGFDVTPVIARDWHEFVTCRDSELPGDFHSLYAPNGSTPAAGEQFINPALARSYSLLANEGREVFYQGELAQRLSEFIQAQGGAISEQDLSSHSSEWIEPVSINYRGYDVFELLPNGQGMVVLQMLQMLKHEDLASMGFMSIDAIHTMIEVKKLAFEDRAKFYADTEHVELPVNELISEAYAQRRRTLLDKQAAKIVKADSALLAKTDTVYLCTADAEGNMVSLIQSVFYPFGSAMVVPETGFALQNRGISFSLDLQHPNVYAAGKRPFHTIIPAFVLKDGQPLLSFGVMGADMQAQGQVQVLTNIIDFNMNIQQAGDVPRWRHDGSTAPMDTVDAYLTNAGKVILEPDCPVDLPKQLQQRGHDVEISTEGFGGYQAILRQADHYQGASECRKDGYAKGH